MSAPRRSVAVKVAAAGVVCGVAAAAWLRLVPAAAPDLPGPTQRVVPSGQTPPDGAAAISTPHRELLLAAPAGSRAGDPLPSSALTVAGRVVPAASATRTLPDKSGHPATPAPDKEIRDRVDTPPSGPTVMMPAGGASATAETVSPSSGGAEVAIASTASASPAVSVPPGERLPALFYDERPLPLPQRRALDRVANEFIDAVGDGGSAGSPAAWGAARAKADRQYITLYGHAAYNALHLQAAKEAAREARAAAAR